MVPIWGAEKRFSTCVAGQFVPARVANFLPAGVGTIVPALRLSGQVVRRAAPDADNIKTRV
ncbi:hypothetical protein D6B98_02200 [Bradyrhizobium sp. LVM 105]|nr:hypothetical protein D6B98_02200 [Bradyrhizobium sp. LVM 105]